MHSIGSASRHRRRPAFTMTEMVIVIMVMGIVAAAATPAFLNSLLHHRVASAAHRLKTDLELARQTARLTSSTQSITFVNSSYLMTTAVKDFDDPSVNYAVDLSGSPYEVNSVTANFGGAQIVSFNGYGLPSNGGTVVIASSGHSSTVTLDAATGEVTITSTDANVDLEPADPDDDDASP
jgi:prepilin-type N-terminal cleavage/methylation domain-containing protein